MGEQEGNPTVVALALIEHGGRFLFLRHEEVHPPYYRPPGGHVMFGERAAEAAARETKEESGAEIQVLDRYAIIEDIFRKEGSKQHEVVLLYRAHFRDPANNGREDLRFSEPDGTSRPAVWLSGEELGGPGMKVLPNGLAELLA